MASHPPPEDAPAVSPAAGASPAPPVFRLGRRPALDGLRGLAVVLVLAHHSTAGKLLEQATGLRIAGFLGVDVFFVLSGFLVSTLLLEEHRRTGTVAVGRFMWRRFTRVYPALLALLVLSTFYVAWAPDLLMADHLRSLRATATHTGNLLVLRTEDPGLTHPLIPMWSLAVEEQFYLVWPFLLLIFCTIAVRTRWLVAAVGTVAVAGVAGRLWALGHYDSWQVPYQLTIARLDQFAAGALVAVALVRGGKVRGAVWLQCVFATGLVVLVLTQVRQDGSYFRFGAVPTAVVVAGLIATVIDGRGPVARALSTRAFMWLGAMSFSLYLFHTLAFGWVARAWPDLSERRLAVAELVAAFALALVAHHLIERPALRLRARFDRRRVAPAAPTGNPPAPTPDAPAVASP